MWRRFAGRLQRPSVALTRRCNEMGGTTTNAFANQLNGVAIRHYMNTFGRNTVTLLGAAGALGQNLALLLKDNAHIAELRLFDIKDTSGIATDLQHINTSCKVVYFTGKDQYEQALHGADVVLMAAANKPKDQDEDDQATFLRNAELVKELTQEYAKHCPKAMLLILTDPINYMVPLAGEVLKKKKTGCHIYERLCGVTNLHHVRANTLVARKCDVALGGIEVPVVGGASPDTMVPLFSPAVGPTNSTLFAPYHLGENPTFAEDENGTKRVEPHQDQRLGDLVHEIQHAEEFVRCAKANGQGSTLAAAFAAARFTRKLLDGMNGHRDASAYAFVRYNKKLVMDLVPSSSSSSPDQPIAADTTATQDDGVPPKAKRKPAKYSLMVPYYNTRVVFGKQGIARNLPTRDAKLWPPERQLMQQRLIPLSKQIKFAQEYIKPNKERSEAV